jgi:hypothetical protein
MSKGESAISTELWYSSEETIIKRRVRGDKHENRREKRKKWKFGEKKGVRKRKRQKVGGDIRREE